MTASESTPLNGGIRMPRELNQFMTNLIGNEGLRSAGSTAQSHLRNAGTAAQSHLGHASVVAQDRFAEARQQASTGDFSMRLIALFAGVLLVASGFLGFFFSLLSHFDVVGALMYFYVMALGLVILVLESRQLNVPEQTMRKLYRYAAFLKYVWGRGALYFVAGSLLLIKFSWLNLVVGGYTMVVGVVYIFVGHVTAKKLQDLRKTLTSEQTLKTKFNEADTSSTGDLSLEEFRNLVVSLGLDMNLRESEAAFLHMDRTDKGRVTYEDFKVWWTRSDAILDGADMIV